MYFIAEHLQCLSLGAQSVVLTDRSTSSAKANLEANKDNFSGREITVSRLEWGQDVSSFNPPFDVLLAADVVYIEDYFHALIKSLSELSSSETVVLLSCKHRYEREDQFIELLRDSFDIEPVWSEQSLKIYYLRKIHAYQETN